jgi:hypothetical protein
MPKVDQDSRSNGNRMAARIEIGHAPSNARDECLNEHQPRKLRPAAKATGREQICLD